MLVLIYASIEVTLDLIYVLFGWLGGVSFVLAVCGRNIEYIATVEDGPEVRLLCVRFVEALLGTIFAEALFEELRSSPSIYKF